MDNDIIRQLMDEREIKYLLNEYCRALDLMDLSLLDGVFAQDCIVEFGPDERLNSTGLKQVKTALQRLWRWSRTSHHLSNVQIAFDGADRANAVSYVIAWHERADHTAATIYGQYHDQLERTGLGWRISSRTMYMNGCDAGFTVDIHPFPRKSAPEGWVAPQIDR